MHSSKCTLSENKFIWGVLPMAKFRIITLGAASIGAIWSCGSPFLLWPFQPLSIAM